MKEWRGMTSSG